MLTIALAMSACTTSLRGTKVDNFANTTKGQVYYLPRSEYQITVSRELKACSLDYKDEADAVLAWLGGQFETLGITPPGKAAAAFDAIAADAVLERPEIRQAVDLTLGVNWQREMIPDPGDAPSTTGVKKPAKQPRILSDDSRNAKIDLIAKLKLAPDLDFKVELTALAVASFAPDASHTYSLDYDLMSDVLKATDYVVETYPGGTLKSVNVTIDDQTGPALLSFISGATKLAAAAGGFPLAAPDAHALVAPPLQRFSDWRRSELDRRALCKPDVRWKLYQSASLEAQADKNAASSLATAKDVDKLNQDLLDAAGSLDKAKAELQGLDEKDPKRKAALELVTTTDAAVKESTKKLQAAKSKLTALSQGATTVNERLHAVRKALTLVHTTTFRPTVSALTLTLPGAVEVIQAWVPQEHLGACQGRPACIPDINQVAGPISAQAAIYAPSLPASGGKSANEKGVFYRQPLQGTLLVCKAAPCVSGDAIVALPEAVLVNSKVDVPQLGAFAVLPLKNGPFQNNTISASFAENGTLTKVAYKTNAALAKAAEVFDSSADSIMKFREAKRNQEASKIETSASELAAKKKLVDAQLALEKSQADLASFRTDQSQKTAE